MHKKGPLLAEGRTSEIFAWGTDQVLKLYREALSPKSAPYEYRPALASHKTGYLAETRRAENSMLNGALPIFRSKPIQQRQGFHPHGNKIAQRFRSIL